MDYESMELSELKEIAKEKDIKVGKISKEKLIEKLIEKDTVASLMCDDEDLSEDVVETKMEVVEKQTLLEAISDVIDDIDESVADTDDYNDTLELTDTIPVKSITFGGLTYKSRSNNAVFRWSNIGAIQYMTVAELNEMNNMSGSFLNEPLLILMDERAIKKFRLTNVYENVAKINNLTRVFNSDMQTIEKVVDDALRVNMRNILISKISQMYKNKKLVDINIIRMLEKKLKFDLSNSNIE